MLSCDKLKHPVRQQLSCDMYVMLRSRYIMIVNRRRCNRRIFSWTTFEALRHATPFLLDLSAIL